MAYKTQYSYFGARYYDSDLSVWLSVDPLSDKYPSMSPYMYVAGNPVKLIDPNGKEIVVPNKADRVAILKMINNRALGTYAFDDNGKLYIVKEEGADGFSQYYRDRLILAIDDENHTIEVIIDNEIRKPILDDNELTWTKDVGEEYNVDIDAGGGVTFGYPGTDQIVYISGNSYYGLLDTEGNPLRDDPADILMHELLGHAIPMTVGSDTGNAVDNENKGREQLQKGMNQLRAPEPYHYESNEGPVILEDDPN